MESVGGFRIGLQVRGGRMSMPVIFVRLCVIEFLSSLHSSTIIPQGSHKPLKRYSRAKKLDSPDGKKVVRQGLLYLYLLKACLLHPPWPGVELPTFPVRASSDRSLYH